MAAEREISDRGREGPDRGAGRLGQADGDAEERLASSSDDTRAARSGSAPAVPPLRTTAATIPKACASARSHGIAARSRSGRSASSGTSTTRSNSGTRNIKVALRQLRRFAREGRRGAGLRRARSTLRRATRLARHPIRAGAAQRGEGPAVPRRRRLYGGHVQAGARSSSRRHAASSSTPSTTTSITAFTNVFGGTTGGATPSGPPPGTCCTYPRDYRAIFVGDATHEPYEIMQPGGSVEYWNDEAGARLDAACASAVGEVDLAEPGRNATGATPSRSACCAR